MKSINEKTCSLCDLPVEITGFRLETKEGQKDFCCEGCLSVYQLFNQDNIPPIYKEKEKKK